jgi:membrane-associated protein
MNYFDPNVVVSNLGLVGILFMIFAEIGLLIGLVLPGGDTLLFLSGLAASNAGALVFGDAQISAPLLFILAPIVAIIAGEFSYWTGAKYGRKLFARPDGRYFNQKNVVKAEKWLVTYGVGKALVLSKFVSVVRTRIAQRQRCHTYLDQFVQDRSNAQPHDENYNLIVRCHRNNSVSYFDILSDLPL